MLLCQRRFFVCTTNAITVSDGKPAPLGNGFSGFYKFGYDGYKCRRCNGKHKPGEMLPDKREIAEKIIKEQEKPYPDESSDYVEGKEFSVLHGRYPGKEWREGPNDRHEARKNNCLCSIF